MDDRVERLDVAVYVIPTATPESDGTFEWDRTTMVLVQASAQAVTGIGYTYADRATGVFVEEHLRDLVVGANAFEPQRTWDSMRHAIRNVGRPGVASMAMAAVDCALWDLKARLLEMPLVTLLGARRDSIPVYGSGGFTSYSDEALGEQLGGWARQGLRMVKMKVGRDPDSDPRRVRVAREAIGPDVELFVDANGAYTAADAVAQARRFAEHGVSYFEEPVSSDDVHGLARVRRELRGRMNVAAGEYGYDLPYFERMLDAGAVDILQADVTRCAGITELIRVARLCETRGVPLSLHTAPSLHLHAACALERVCHLEYFHDHVRVERMLFEGFSEPADGALAPDLTRAGNGIAFRSHAGRQFAIG